MTMYKCKCGRIVSKSTNADNTGNRDTAGCEGCPYLLPWGPFQYVAGKGYVQDVQGYECRMSKDLEYATRFAGAITDKCGCYIAGLDFDFLARVSDWIRETYPGGELHGRFSLDNIRAVEYCSSGRYRMSITCAQNKKGIAAKAALLRRFFDDSGARLDMTPEEEKAHILAAIKTGKAKAHKKEERMIYKDPRNGCFYRVSPEPDNEGLYHVEFRDPSSSATFEIWPPLAIAGISIREKMEEALASQAKGSRWVPTTEADKPEAEDVPAGFDYSGFDDQTGTDLHLAEREYATALEPTEADTEDFPCNDCWCPECDDQDCPQAHCDKSDNGVGCIAPNEECPPRNPTCSGAAIAVDAKTADIPRVSGLADTTAAPVASSKEPTGAAPMHDPVGIDGSTCFDYSGLDDQTGAGPAAEGRSARAASLAEVAEEQIDQELAEAMSLHGKILAGGQVLAQSLVEFARRLKEMRDRRLYSRLGCESFEEYVESRVGLRQRQAYTYISTLERLGPQLMEQNAGLGITKLQLLSQITGPDRVEFAREHDLAGMSVAEVEALVKRANDQGQQLSMFAEELEDAKAQEANYKKLYEQAVAEMEQRVANRVEEQAAQARRQAWEEAKAEVTKAQSQAADAARVEMAGRLEEERRARQEAERKAKEARQKAKDAQKMLKSRDEEMFRKVEAAREEGLARGRSQAAQDALADRQRAEKEQEVASDRQTGRFAMLFEQLQRCISEMEEILEQLRRQGREDQAEKLARAREQALADVMKRGRT